MRSRREPARGRLALAAGAACAAALFSLVAGAASDVRSGDRFSFALTGARVLAAPGRTFDPGVVVVRGGVIEAVGAPGQVAAPADVPQTGILRGRAAVVSLADGPLSGRVLEAESGQVISLAPEPFDFANFTRVGYPMSKMGAVALVRQSFLDARWWGDAEAAYAKHPAGQARPRFVTASAALLPAARGSETVVFETSDVLALLRSVKIAREMKLRALYVGAGDEYRLRDQVAAAKPDLVLRVAFPRPDKMENEAEWLDVSLERLRAIDRAPSNPKW